MLPVALVALDGVLADDRDGWRGVDRIGPPLPGAIDFVRALGSWFEVVIFTSRVTTHTCGGHLGGVEELEAIVTKWLDQHGFAYHSIWTGQGKPPGAVVIIDRKAVSCRPQVRGDSEYAAAIMDAVELLGGRPR